MTQSDAVSGLRPRLSSSSTRIAISPTLEDVGHGGGVLERGMAGPGVRELQDTLHQRGYDVKVDGQFGPQTEQAVRTFQRDHGATVDGIVGRQTQAKLAGSAPSGDRLDRSPSTSSGGPVVAPTEADRRNAPPGTVRAGDLARNDAVRRTSSQPANPTTAGLAPAGMSEKQKYDYYANIVRAHGGQVNPNGQSTVLGLRGTSRDSGTHDTRSTRSYDDTFVVLTPDGRAREFRGATHPGQTRSSMSPDVNGDGVGDVGMIKPGNYQVVPNGPHAGNASYHVETLGGSDRIPGWRDTNHDGTFSDAEKAASARRGDTLGAILFHQGNTDSPSSIGCQTLPPAIFDSFIKSVGGSRAGFSYTLVDAGK